MNLLLYLGLVLQLDLCYCVFCTRELELTKGFVISLFTTMALLGIHGADIVNELIHRIEENFEDVPADNRSRDACKIGRFAKLRYLHRQLLKPPNIPCTPLAGLTRRLYQLCSHPYTQLASALEGHVVCWIVAKAIRLSASPVVMSSAVPRAPVSWMTAPCVGKKLQMTNTSSYHRSTLN